MKNEFLVEKERIGSRTFHSRPWAQVVSLIVYGPLTIIDRVREVILPHPHQGFIDSVVGNLVGLADGLISPFV